MWWNETWRNFSDEKKFNLQFFVDEIPENVSNSPLTSAIQYLEKEFKPIEWMTVYKNFMKINS